MVKTLGVTWLPDEDVFAFKGNPPIMNCLNLSKETVQNIANSSHKSVLLEEKWATGLDWDDLFQEDLANKSQKWI